MTHGSRAGEWDHWWRPFYQPGVRKLSILKSFFNDFFLTFVMIKSPMMSVFWGGPSTEKGNPGRWRNRLTGTEGRSLWWWRAVWSSESWSWRNEVVWLAWGSEQSPAQGLIFKSHLSQPSHLQCRTHPTTQTYGPIPAQSDTTRWYLHTDPKAAFNNDNMQRWEHPSLIIYLCVINDAPDWRKPLTKNKNKNWPLGDLFHHRYPAFICMSETDVVTLTFRQHVAPLSCYELSCVLRRNPSRVCLEI